MRTTTLYANELGIETDSTGQPNISRQTAWQFVLQYAPWANAMELVSGGIKCWESEDEHHQWRAQR